MVSETYEIEGAWEEILVHAPELVGRKVRVTVPPPQQADLTDGTGLSERNQQMLAAFEKYKNEPLTDEDVAAFAEIERRVIERRSAMEQTWTER